MANIIIASFCLTMAFIFFEVVVISICVGYKYFNEISLKPLFYLIPSFIFGWIGIFYLRAI